MDIQIVARNERETHDRVNE